MPTTIESHGGRIRVHGAQFCLHEHLITPLGSRDALQSTMIVGEPSQTQLVVGRALSSRAAP